LVYTLVQCSHEGCRPLDGKVTLLADESFSETPQI